MALFYFVKGGIPMKNRKLLISILVVLCVCFISATLFTACGKDNHTHSYTEHVIIKATCTEAGVSMFSCDCGNTYIEEIPADHDYINHPAKKNCNEVGWEEYQTCSRCDYTTYKEIPALGHDYINHPAKAETCIEVGWEEYQTCSRCDYTTYVEIPATSEHNTNGNNGLCLYCGLAESTPGLDYSQNSDGTYTVTRIGSCKETDIVIGLHNGKNITSIGGLAFFNCESLTRITIPASVTSIGDRAFEGCKSLTSVAIPDSVTSIGEYTFFNCDSLTSITIPDSVTSISNFAFSSCESLTRISVSTKNPNYKSIDGNLYSKNEKNLIQYAIGKTNSTFTIPDSVTSISIYAFKDCASLSSITIPDSVTSIGNQAFEHCNSLTSVAIPNSVTSIGSWTFMDCVNLTSVTIGNGVKTIDKFAFQNCYRLVEVINKSPYITVTTGDTSNGYIGYYSLVVYNSNDTFTGTKLSNDNGYIVYTNGAVKVLVGYNGEQTDLVLSSDITEINQYAFRNCDNLTSVTIDDNVKNIGNQAFFECHNLTSVTIGINVKNIDKAAFYGCDKLTIVHYKGTASDWANISFGSNNYDLTNATRYYYVENEADVPKDGGNYWHYVDGVPTKW